MPDFKSKEEYEKWKAERQKKIEEGIVSEKYTKNNEETLDYQAKSKISKRYWVRSKFFSGILIILAIIVIISGYVYLKKNHELSILKKDAVIVITEFEKLSASLEIGMNYKDYIDKLGQINYFLSRFITKHEKYSDKNNIYLTLSNIMNIHLSCAENWEKAINLGDSYILKLTKKYISICWVAASMSL